MPSQENLPEALKPLANCQAVGVSHARFDSDAKRLIDAIRERAPTGKRPGRRPR
jgi:hypothetical protein